MMMKTVISPPLIIHIQMLDQVLEVFDVVPDYDLATAEGISLDNLQEIMNNNLQELNTMVASYEKVSNIIIHREEFLKTPKRSIKRYLYSAERLGLN